MPDRVIGEIAGFPTGSTFDNRKQLSESGIHRPTQGGICGGALDGAESVCLSGGYPEDEDGGNVIIYTGQGGQDPNTKRQIKDQELTRGNVGLKISFEERTPIRVTRGAGLSSRWAPDSGYRYDGLFYVTGFWDAIGRDGFKIYRYRLEGNPPANIWGSNAPDTAERRQFISNKIIRDAALARRLKVSYDFTCQICGIKLDGPDGPYAETAHIKPLGKPFNGPDIKENMLCLCPNHHKLFDMGAIRVDHDYRIIDFKNDAAVGKLVTRPRHTPSPKYIRWHWDNWA